MSSRSVSSGSPIWLALALTLLLASASLHAQQALAISLKGAAQVPAVKTAATGSAQITVLPDQTLKGSVQTSGMVATTAHLHEGSSGENGPAIITLARTTDDAFVVPAATRLSDAQYARFKAGELYLNVHSAAHPEGEIRGQLLRLEIADSPLPWAD